MYDITGKELTTVYNINGNTISLEHRDLLGVNKDLYFFKGRLYKQGRYIVDAKGNPIELRGIGTHGLLQYTNLHTYECMKSLRDLGVNLIRCTVYLEDYTFVKSDGIKAYGYLAKPDETKAEIDKIIEYCEQLGMYVLLDWHVYSWGAGTGSGIFHETEATEFFTYFATKYADKPFVMYELANEPHHQTLDEYVPFIKNMYTLIHSLVENPIIVTGTCSVKTTELWDRLIEEGIDDIFISPHAYGTQIDTDRYQTLIDYGIPIFNTEWGNAQASGDGAREDARATALLKYYHKMKIPYSVWKLTDQDMTCAVLKNVDSINYEGYVNGFDKYDLSPEGALYFTWFKYYATIGHNR